MWRIYYHKPRSPVFQQSHRGEGGRVSITCELLEQTLSNSEGFGTVARQAILWTASTLDLPNVDPSVRERRREFLTGRPRSFLEGDFLFVHGSARNPLTEYVFPEDIYNERKMSRIFALVERYCFQGHTHLPGIFTERLQFMSPEELDDLYRLDGGKTLVNVGSVGQPRDGDWRACYVLLDDPVVRFRRVEYDIEETIKKIRDNDDLNDFLGDRLRDGR